MIDVIITQTIIVVLCILLGFGLGSRVTFNTTPEEEDR